MGRVPSSSGGWRDSHSVEHNFGGADVRFLPGAFTRPAHHEGRVCAAVTVSGDDGRGEGLPTDAPGMEPADDERVVGVPSASGR